MIFGAHSYIYTPQWSDATLGVLDRMHAAGLHCAELGVGDDVSFTPALTRRRAAQLGMALLISPGGAWPVACDISSDDAGERREGLSWHQRQVDLAAELGAVAYCGALYGHPGTVRRRLPPPDELARVAEALHALAAYAAARGVQIVLEPMSHFRTHLINTPIQLAALLRQAAHPNLHALLDTYHLVTEVRDYAQAVRDVAPWLWGIHACENDRGAPGGGLVPWAALARALHALTFDGYIMFESYNSSAGDFAVQRGMFHNVCPDSDAFVTQGLRFMQHVLAEYHA